MSMGIVFDNHMRIDVVEIGARFQPSSIHRPHHRGRRAEGRATVFRIERRRAQSRLLAP
ncbi:MAG: hypothetical protein HMLKMBBP_00083 [Planctomycetes bacterium]|nr:hypothetical protein [Planctomycetota bacterium]